MSIFSIPPKMQPLLFRFFTKIILIYFLFVCIYKEYNDFNILNRFSKEVPMKHKILIFFTAIILSILTVMPVYAAVEEVSNETVYLDKYTQKYEWTFDLDDPKDASEVLNLKSSNTKVLTVKKRNTSVEKDGEDVPKFFNVVLEVKFKKPGKANITYSYKNENGETVNVKKKLTVKKWVNPVSSLKIGSKQFKTKFNKNSEATIKKSQISNKKIKIKLKKGYKLKEVWTFSNNQRKTHGRSFKMKFNKGDIFGFSMEKNGAFIALWFKVK